MIYHLEIKCRALSILQYCSIQSVIGRKSRPWKHPSIFVLLLIQFLEKLKLTEKQMCKTE